MIDLMTMIIGLLVCFLLALTIIQYAYACGRYHERQRMIKLELQKKKMPLNSNAAFKKYEEFFDHNFLNTPIAMRYRK